MVAIFCASVAGAADLTVGIRSGANFLEAGPDGVRARIVLGRDARRDDRKTRPRGRGRKRARGNLVYLPVREAPRPPAIVENPLPPEPTVAESSVASSAEKSQSEDVVELKQNTKQQETSDEDEAGDSFGETPDFAQDVREGLDVLNMLENPISYI